MPGTDLAGWTARLSPAPIVLEGRYARLEPLDPVRHADGLFAALMGEGSVNEHLYLFETTMSRPDFQKWIEAKAKRTDIQCHVVIDRQTGRIGGRQDFLRIDNAHGVIEIGSIHWGPSIARSRVATEALYLFARHAFEDMGYRRFEWKCNNANEPSKRAAKRFGFAYEGLFRQHMVAKGANRDTAWFAMLDHEWPYLRAGYEAWLAPENFDAEGRQKRGLGEFLDAACGAELPEFFRTHHLRRACAADYEPLVALQQSAYATNRAITGRMPIPLQWDYRDVLRDWECFVLDGNGRFDAAMIGRSRPEDYYIESLSVHPEGQGTGVGNMLLKAGETRARQFGRDIVRFITNMKLHRNVDWYLASGYTIERIERREDRDIAHFVKSIQEE
jgi:RimJ/RimL family protein N-acetyltransferase/ribosomal protein S18 acetylase RimI-like enzyme